MVGNEVREALIKNSTLLILKERSWKLREPPGKQRQEEWGVGVGVGRDCFFGGLLQGNLEDRQTGAREVRKLQAAAGDQLSFSRASSEDRP